MRRLVVHVVAAALAIAGFYFLAAGPASADTECQVTDPETGLCLITVEVPGIPGDPGSGGDDGPSDMGPSGHWLRQLLLVGRDRPGHHHAAARARGLHVPRRLLVER